METLDDIRTRASEGMRGYLANEGPERTRGVRQAAEALAEARSHFFNREGEPDILGRSYDYRQWVKAALDDADVPPSTRPSLQSAIRFHISPILRERYGEDELTDLGLKPGSTVERGSRRRQRDARTLGLFRGGPAIDDLDDALLVANLARLAVTRVVVISTATPKDIAELSAAFTRLAAAARDAAKRVAG
ncbi:hypothetical protein SEA_HONK_24 [Microbacterium phage Honk]|uniref:Uncharacterized protein n=1 Tax=Microbacterium phage Honk TaxID=2836095 RepID=A0A8F3INU0_9CAUD|nr:hypothetical protein SEA_HONK_24 [Microbacterium phage Honk]